MGRVRKGAAGARDDTAKGCLEEERECRRGRKRRRRRGSGCCGGEGALFMRLSLPRGFQGGERAVV